MITPHLAIHLPHFKFNADNGGDLFFVGTGVIDAFCRGGRDAFRVDLHEAALSVVNNLFRARSRVDQLGRLRPSP